MVWHFCGALDEPPGCDGAAGCVLAATFFRMLRSSTTRRNSGLSLVNVQKLDRDPLILLEDL